MTNGEGVYLTINEAAVRLNVSRQTIHTWIKRGKLKPVQTPGGRQRIPAEQLIINESKTLEQLSQNFYKVIDISDLDPYRPEEAGSKEKNWYLRDEMHWYWESEGKEFLFKSGREGTGEDWAEKIAAELCKLLDLPHAEYEFANYKDKNGVITPNFVPDKTNLFLGNEILIKIVKGYDGIKYKQKKHTLTAVLGVIGLKSICLPFGWLPKSGIESAVDVFLGYLLLDTLIGNTDRHHENWGLIFDRESKKFHLAPTFDHASSLGREESDESRIVRLTTKDAGRGIYRYATKARSAIYLSETDNKPLSTFDAFLYASKYKNWRDAARAWLDILGGVSQKEIEKIISMVPQKLMSDVSKDFTIKLLEINKQRLLSLEL